MQPDVAGSRAYRSDRRAAQARRTRQHIIGAATQVFRERGYAGATMRDIAARAGVSVPTVELLFGTKVGILKVAIDVAIAGDDESVAVLDRQWADDALNADSASTFFDIVARVLTPAQARSAGLILAVFEAATTHPALVELAQQLTAHRKATAEWVINTLRRKAPLRDELTIGKAVETLWVLMDPAMFDRVVKQLGWSTGDYQEWFARSARTLLVADTADTPELAADTADTADLAADTADSADPANEFDGPPKGSPP